MENILTRNKAQFLLFFSDQQLATTRKNSNIIIALIARFSSSDMDMIWVKTKALIATALYDGKTSGTKYDQAICCW